MKSKVPQQVPSKQFKVFNMPLPVTDPKVPLTQLERVSNFPTHSPRLDVHIFHLGHSAPTVPDQ